MDHQDWKTVILNNPNAAKTKTKTKTNIIKKKTDDEKTAKLRAIDTETETFKIPKIDKKISKQISEARCHLKMSQKELANKLNLPVKTIVDYENGKAIPENRLLNKIKNTLKINIKK